MRDLVLAAFIVGMLPMIFVRPAFGALMWVWISMMVPHTATYGFASSVPWALIIALVTLTALLFTRKKRPLPMNGGTVLILIFLGWMTVTSIFALNKVEGEVMERWIFALKILFMLLVTFMLLRGRKEIEWLLWTMVISVGSYGVKGGLWTLASGGGGRVWGPPGGNLAGNNEFAVGLVILLPWMFYLRAVATRAWIRHALLGSMIAVAFGILGTQSRGALLALTAMALVLGVKSKRLIRTTFVLAVVGVGALTFMPDSWTSRMDTIQSYQADTSAMSRIWTWKTLWNVAVDRPLVGAGFRADNRDIFAKYAPREGYEIFQGSVFVAHSIYMSALGEHGFVGLGIYLALGLWTWFAASRLAKQAQDVPGLQDWVPLLMRMTQVSLMGFAVGGAFLSLLMLDLTYYITGIVVLSHAAVKEASAQRAAAGQRATTKNAIHREGIHVTTGQPPA